MRGADNPCLSCPDICCGLKGECGLRLSPAEFAAHFEAHSQSLRVRRDGKVVILATKEGLVCPNLGDKGCRIYDRRPIDCRLYPYQMVPVYETRKRVKFLLYLTPECMANQTFPVPEPAARTLVESFCREVYGDKTVQIQVFEDKFLAKLKNKFAAQFFKMCARFGIN